MYDKIGTGKFSEVVKAKSKSKDTYYAIKKILKQRLKAEELSLIQLGN